MVVLLWWIPSTTEMLDGGAPSQLLRAEMRSNADSSSPAAPTALSQLLGAYFTGDNVQATVAGGAALYKTTRWCRVSSGLA